MHLTCDEDASVMNIDISGFWKRSVAHIVTHGTFQTTILVNWLDWDNDGSNETVKIHYYSDITKTTNRNYVKIVSIPNDSGSITGQIITGTYYCSSGDDTITIKGNTINMANALYADATLANNGNTLILVWKGAVSVED